MTQILLSPSGRATDPVTILDTPLDNLANNAGALSGVVPNTSNLDLYVDLELLVTFAAAPTANTTVDVYFVRSVDGVNFEDGAGGATPVIPPMGFAGSIVLTTATTQRKTIPQVLCPPRDFKVLLVNNGTGQAFSTGNTLRGYFYSLSA